MTSTSENSYLAVIVTSTGRHFVTLLEPGEGADDPLPYIWEHLRDEKPSAWTGLWMPNHGEPFTPRFRSAMRQPETQTTWAMFNPDLVSHVEAELYEEAT